MPRPDLGGGDDVAEWLAPRHGVEPAIAAGAWDMMLVGDSIAITQQARGRRRCNDGLDRRVRPIVRTHDMTRIGPYIIAIDDVSLDTIRRSRAEFDLRLSELRAFFKGGTCSLPVMR